MRTAPMCYTVFQVPRCKVYSWVNTWWNGFDNVSRACKERQNFRLLSTTLCEQGSSRRWSRRPITTSGDGRSKNVLSSAANIRHGIADEVVNSVTTNLNILKKDDRKLQQFQCTDFRQLVAANKELAERATFLVFDLETTGFSRKDENIIEIALRDMQGGEESTFQTLVNPGRSVPKMSTEVHGIETKDVCKPGVPRMEELIPMLLQYIKSRQEPDGFVVLVAHNARTFDVPFLVNEFARCGAEIPSDWLFLDTLPMARERMKFIEMKVSMKLESLREYYRINPEGAAHRAMSDVSVLIHVFKQLSIDLKLSKADLIQRTFTATELTSKKKKKDST